MEVIFGMVRNVCAFVLLTTVVNNLMQGSVYRKYIRFFVGIVMLILVINPVMSLLSMDINFQDNISKYIEEAGRYEIYEEIKMGEQNAAENILQEYEKSLDRTLDAIIKAHDLYIVDSRWEIESDYSEENFGEITGLEVRVSSAGELDVRDIGIDGDGNVKISAGTDDKKKELKEKLIEEMAETFNIGRECVQIEILI
ncbi:MAG: stage III sporulation protein AF [Lachnospiraceae bacterium]|nr:stage III sporulation protein AF [Lachnospiraceae bacterium]